MSSELPTDLQAWLTGLRLSQPLRSIRQTFSNGRLVAEVLDKYGALGVSLEASFGSYGSLEKKRSNWELLEKQFKKLDIPISTKLIQAVLNAEEGAAVRLLSKLYAYLEGQADPDGQQQPETCQEGGAAAADCYGSSSAGGMALAGAEQEAHPAVPQPLTWSVGHPAAPAPAFVPDAQQAASPTAAATTAYYEHLPPLLPPGLATAGGWGSTQPGLQDLQAQGHYVGSHSSTDGFGSPSFLPGNATAGAALEQPNASPPPDDGWQSAAAWVPYQAANPGPEFGTAATGGGEGSAAAPPGDPASPFGASPEALVCQPAEYMGEYASQYGLPPYMWQGHMLPQLGPSSMVPPLVQPEAAAGYSWPALGDNQACGFEAAYWQPGQQMVYAPAFTGMQQRGWQGSLAAGASKRAGAGRAAKKATATTTRSSMLRQRQSRSPARDASSSQAPAAGASPPAAGASLPATGPSALAAPEPGSLPGAQPAVAENEASLPRIEYDKRPRPVSFKPHSYQEYRLKDYDVKQAKAYWELGRLGPDFHEHPEWRQKWEKLERQKEFGKAARAANQQKAAEQPAPAPRPKPLSSRERALEFAMRVPRPEVAKPSSEPSMEQAALQLSKLQVQRIPEQERDVVADMIRAHYSGVVAKGGS